jgi:hypothetical protein
MGVRGLVMPEKSRCCREVSLLGANRPEILAGTRVVPHDMKHGDGAGLGDQPRKRLGFRTPREVYTELVEKYRTERVARSTQRVALQT